jgi:hypothetical protein
VVSVLIGVYGGPLLFMEEYRRMLADRLLAKEEYDCVREIRTLELLKIRWAGVGWGGAGCVVGSSICSSDASISRLCLDLQNCTPCNMVAISS